MKSNEKDEKNSKKIVTWAEMTSDNENEEQQQNEDIDGKHKNVSKIKTIIDNPHVLRNLRNKRKYDEYDEENDSDEVKKPTKRAKIEEKKDVDEEEVEEEEEEIVMQPKLSNKKLDSIKNYLNTPFEYSVEEYRIIGSNKKFLDEIIEEYNTKRNIYCFCLMINVIWCNYDESTQEEIIKGLKNDIKKKIKYDESTIDKLLIEGCNEDFTINIKNKGVNNYRFYWFSELFEYLKNMKNLDISENILCEDEVDHFCDNLKFLINLKHLFIEQNKIGTKVLPKIFKYIHLMLDDEGNLHLEEIFGGKKGITPLLSQLKQIPNVKGIFLRGNFLGNDSITKLANKIGQCKKLEELDISNNYLSVKSVESLKQIVKSLPCLKTLHVSNYEVDESKLDILKEIKSDLVIEGRSSKDTDDIIDSRNTFKKRRYYGWFRPDLYG